MYERSDFLSSLLILKIAEEKIYVGHSKYFFNINYATKNEVFDERIALGKIFAIQIGKKIRPYSMFSINSLNFTKTKR